MVVGFEAEPNNPHYLPIANFNQIKFANFLMRHPSLSLDLTSGS